MAWSFVQREAPRERSQMSVLFWVMAGECDDGAKGTARAGALEMAMEENDEKGE